MRRRGATAHGETIDVTDAEALATFVASSAGVLSVVDGTGRALTGWLSDRFGRKQTLTFVLLVAAAGQFGVLYAGEAKNLWLFMFFAFVNGFGSGAFYPLFASLVPDYFGENNNASNYGLVYSAKLVSGLAGGLGAAVIHAWGYHGAYMLGRLAGSGVSGDDPDAAPARPSVRR